MGQLAVLRPRARPMYVPDTIEAPELEGEEREVPTPDKTGMVPSLDIQQNNQAGWTEADPDKSLANQSSLWTRRRDDRDDPAEKD